jgi:hypothetical protein
MRTKKKWLLFMLNLCIVLANIFLFSNAFAGLSLFTGSALSIALAWTVVVLSIGAFFIGNKSLLKTKETRFLMGNVHSLSDCVPVFKESLKNGDVFDVSILTNLEQIERFNRKRDTIYDLLKQKFSVNEMSFQKFSGVLQSVESVIYMNMRSILNKISAFDIAEYESMQRRGFQDDALSREKLKIYNEYLLFITDATKANEDILLKLDRLLLEISRYNSLEGGDVQALPAMVEMDALIRNANLYK